MNIEMIKRHLTFLGIITSLLLLIVSTLYYPGGSQAAQHSVGYNWQNNYLCNLFNEKAMNGLDNAARPLAIAGMFLLCISFAIFFIRFSKKIPSATSAKVIKYAGAGAMVFAFLVITPYHDLMTTAASILALLAIVYISVYLFQSELFFLKVWSIACVVVIGFNNYVYYSKHLLDLLPIMQKVGFVFITIWILGVEYFTKAEDFQVAK